MFQMFHLMMTSRESQPKVPKNPDDIVRVRKPTWGADNSEKKKGEGVGMRATWLGHACFLLELKHGARVLFNPVFSE